MKNILKLLACVMLASYMGHNVLAQGRAAVQNVPARQIGQVHVGDLMPDIPLTTLTGYPEKNISISGFRGKYLLLDFWSTGCVSCMAAFPKMEGLQQQFGKELQIILVNPWERREVIEKRIRSRKPLSGYKLPELPSIMGDSIWTVMFPTRTVPHHVWIDPEGRVMAITGGYNANAKTISAVLKGKRIDMVLKPAKDFDLKTELLIHCLKDRSLHQTQYAVISDFYEGEGGSIYGLAARKIIDTAAGTVRYSFLNNTFLQLYREVAHMKGLELTGNRVIWELSNPEWYMEPEDESKYDTWSRRTRFCYEIVMPLEKSEMIPDVMLKDLNTYLDRQLDIRAGFEKRPRKCVVMYLEAKEKLPYTKGGKSRTIWPSNKEDSTFSFVNTPFTTVFSQISDRFSKADRYNTPNPVKPVTLVNDTGIDTAVDMTFPRIEAVSNFYLTLEKQLAKYGLALREEIREQEVLVIRDK